MQLRHASDYLPLVPRMDPQLLENFRVRPPLGRRPFSRSPIIDVPVWFVHELERAKQQHQRIRDGVLAPIENFFFFIRTLSNSESSSASIAPRCSCANVLRRMSLSSVPRLRLWYTRRARVVSMVSPGRGRGWGGGRSAGDAVEAMCSGVCGIGQGSFSVAGDEDRCLVERNLG